MHAAAKLDLIDRARASFTNYDALRQFTFFQLLLKSGTRRYQAYAACTATEDGRCGNSCLIRGEGQRRFGKVTMRVSRAEIAVGAEIGNLP